MKIQILAIGRNEEIMQTVLRLLNKNESWNAEIALTDEAAMKAFALRNPAIVLLCNGIDDDSEVNLRNYFTGKNPGVIIIQHYGGGSGLLTNELLQALEGKAMR